MTSSVLLAVAVLASAPADTVRVGDVSVPAQLGAAADTVDNYVVQAGERRLTGSTIETRSAIPEGWLIVQENRSVDGTLLSLDSIVVDGDTWATISHGDVTRAGRRHVTFSDGWMRGVDVDSLGNERPVAERVPSGLFDYSLFTLVADQLPLAVGFKTTVATYDITRGPVYVPLEVMAAEDVTVDGTKLEAWKTRVDLGPSSVTRWIDRKTRREIRWSVDIGGREMVGERRRTRRDPLLE
jgi:hypothetical protein